MALIYELDEQWDLFNKSESCCLLDLCLVEKLRVSRGVFPYTLQLLHFLALGLATTLS
ncbi:hypothetical protein NT01EI_3085 [Edwardsiella ictaluri 93-146]|uniref:Uncharacterized protein n=1 Tax=Edwardsiella ictaluri (strain 93-146) TaxID=634503 RepID=C5BAM8_EDWI9|nr:hypothetical protein NT01EI_3085 [Edwardsiella ictaluri 93-146]